MQPLALRTGLEFVDQWLAFHAANDDLPGFAVAVHHSNRLVFARAYGQANVEKQELLTTDHLFNIGSQAKMFTAVAIMQLSESSKLTLDDLAAAHLPWLAEHHDERFGYITIRRLLWHGAGLVRDGGSADYWQLLAPFPDQAALRQLILSSELAIEGNTRLKYSNLGYALLGQIIEAASGQTYAEYVTTHIIQPLDLQHTVVGHPAAIGQYAATAYSRPINRRRLAAPPIIPVHSFAAVTGIYSTASDMCRFMAAQCPGDSRLLGDQSKKTLHNSVRGHWQPPAYRGSEYGLGFFTRFVGKRRVIGHGGGFVGYQTCTYLDPLQQLTVSVAANSKDASVLNILRGVFGALNFFEDNASVPASPERTRMNGVFANLWGTIQIVATNKRIVCIYPENWEPFEPIPEELEYVDDTTLNIRKSHDLAALAETVKFRFAANDITSITHAGSTFWSEQQYSNAPTFQMPQ